MFNINFAYDWIQTADLWYQKPPLYQLSHNHFPGMGKCLQTNVQDLQNNLTIKYAVVISPN